MENGNTPVNYLKTALKDIIWVNVPTISVYCMYYATLASLVLPIHYILSKIVFNI